MRSEFINLDNYYNPKQFVNNIVDEKKIKSPEEMNKTQEEDKKKEDKSFDKEKVDKAVKNLNKSLEDESVHAEYSVHEDFGTVMIKIVDDTTKEVILEIPPEKVLDMVASMCKQVGLFDKKA